MTTVIVPSSEFTSTGTPNTFEAHHEVGMPITFNFCGTCGVYCWKTGAGWPGSKIVFAGTLDGEHDLEDAKPDAELWTKYRVKWAAPHGGQELQAFPGEWDREKNSWVEVAN